MYSRCVKEGARENIAGIRAWRVRNRFPRYFYSPPSPLPGAVVTRQERERERESGPRHCSAPTSNQRRDLQPQRRPSSLTRINGSRLSSRPRSFVTPSQVVPLHAPSDRWEGGRGDAGPAFGDVAQRKIQLESSFSFKSGALMAVHAFGNVRIYKVVNKSAGVGEDAVT